MIGHRLVIKRKVPKGREKLFAVFAGLLAVVGLVILAQMKATLSAKALTSVKSDLANMRSQIDNGTAAAAPQVQGASTSASDAASQKAVEQFKKLLQDSSTK